MIMVKVMLMVHIIKVLSINSPLGVTQTIKPMNSLISGTHDTTRGDYDQVENKAMGINSHPVNAPYMAQSIFGPRPLF